MSLKILVCFQETYVCFYLFAHRWSQNWSHPEEGANGSFVPHIRELAWTTGISQVVLCKAKLSQVWKVSMTPGIALTRPRWRWVFPPKEKIINSSVRHSRVERSRPWTEKERLSFGPMPIAGIRISRCDSLESPGGEGAGNGQVELALPYQESEE